MAHLVLSNFAVDRNRLRLNFSLPDGATKLNENINAIHLIADNQVDLPFEFLFDRSTILAALGDNTFFELNIDGLPSGFKYGFYLQENWGDGTENTITLPSPAKFVLASRPGKGELEFNGKPTMDLSGNGDIQVSNLKFKVKFPSNTGGIDLKTITFYVNADGAISNNVVNISFADIKAGFKSITGTEASILNSVTLPEAAKVSFFVSIGNDAGESLLSNILEFRASMKPLSPTELVATSRFVDNNMLKIPVEFKVNQSDLEKWNYYSVLIQNDDGTFTATDVFNVQKPTGFDGSTSIINEITATYNGSLATFTGYALVVVLSNATLVAADSVNINGNSVSLASESALAFTSATGAFNTRAEFTSTKTISKTAEGDLSGEADVVNNMLATENTGDLKVSFMLNKKNSTRSLFSKIETMPSGSSSSNTVAFPNFITNGSWTVDDEFELNVKLYKVLNIQQQGFNVSPPLATGNILILSENKLAFRAPQNLPKVGIDYMFPVTIDTNGSQQNAVNVAWSAVEPPNNVVLEKYQLQLSSYANESARFELDNNGNKVMDVNAVVCGSDDILENTILVAFLSGSRITMGGNGDIVFVRIRAVYEENGVEANSDWSNWTEYQIPLDTLPPVAASPAPAAEEIGLGNLEITFDAPTVPDGWDLNGFDLKLFNQNGVLVRSVSENYIVGKTSYVINQPIPEAEQDQYIMPLVIPKFKSNVDNKIVLGSATPISKVFMHKQIVIKSVNVRFDGTSVVVDAIVDEGQKPGTAQVAALIPHVDNSQQNKTVVELTYDNAKKIYTSSSLTPIEKLAYANIVTIVLATNAVSTDYSLYPPMPEGSIMGFQTEGK